MVFGYKAKQAGIREIDRVISTYPVVILGDAAMNAVAGSFPDPLGIGSQLSLVLAIFGEMVCTANFRYSSFEV